MINICLLTIHIFINRLSYAIPNSTFKYLRFSNQ
uniref:Uncharacterized protein n=1 Tax=uncultured bacterium BLR12 TaxID=506514 RepID=C0INH0_9BACT|nr:hypothetical protein AKSOIL_0241 [uncultured bacterium BLR12]